MVNGTIKWFNSTKGFGLIKPALGTGDVFLHIFTVERAGISRVSEGQPVAYEVVIGQDGRKSASSLALT